MRKRLITGLLAASAALASSVSGAAAYADATHADAAATWTVAPGGTATANAIAGTLSLTDVSTATVGTCKSSTVTGMLKKGSGLSGHDIGTVTAASFGNCFALGSLRLKVTSSGLPWRISVTSYNSKTEVVTGIISGIKVVLTGACGATVNGSSGTAADGEVNAVFNDPVGELTFLPGSGNLHYWDVTKGCGELINDGDPVALTASYEIRPLQHITSP
ncbi:MAG TPA: hypothetical protein VGH27_23550 [Streptosporangiaceae bacterium]|jgi:hypothetical protein